VRSAIPAVTLRVTGVRPGLAAITKSENRYGLLKLYHDKVTAGWRKG
jgi:hypothetical protein